MFPTLTLSQNSYSNFKKCTLYKETASYVGKEHGLWGHSIPAFPLAGWASVENRDDDNRILQIWRTQ